jgi:hypothetical protein
MNDQLTSETMKLNEVAPPGFCDEPFILSNEVKALRREVNAMRDALLQLVDVMRQKSESPITKEGAPS